MTYEPSTQVIWKHRLRRQPGWQYHNIHKGARILHVNVQEPNLCLWEQHDVTETETQRMGFSVVGTGWKQEFDKPCWYIGTIHDGEFVWHIFGEQPDV